MEEINPQTLLEILCECYAMENGLVLESLTIKKKEKE
jgi:hypothetical protein